MTDVQAPPDAWQLDSGLRDDMVISIQGAYFAPHADYQGGQQLMLWLLGTDEANEPVELRMSIGSDWQTADGGTTITHPTKRKQHINKSCIYGHWIASCFEIPDLAKVLVERGQPTNSKVWIDLILHLQAKTLHWGGEIQDQERLMPTEYMGLTVDIQPATVLAAPAPAPAPVVAPSSPEAPVSAAQERVAAARAAAAQSAAQSNGSPLFARAIDLAKAAPDFATFVGQAFNDPDILSDDELAEQCADEGGIWAKAHA